MIAVKRELISIIIYLSLLRLSINLKNIDENQNNW